MPRRVATKRSVRNLIRDFKLREFCDEHRLLDGPSGFKSSISWTFDGWDGRGLSDEFLEAECLRLLLGVLDAPVSEWMFEDLESRFTLPADWGDEDWDRCRFALAVAILEAYYDSLP